MVVTGTEGLGPLTMQRVRHHFGFAQDTYVLIIHTVRLCAWPALLLPNRGLRFKKLQMPNLQRTGERLGENPSTAALAFQGPKIPTWVSSKALADQTATSFARSLRPGSKPLVFYHRGTSNTLSSKAFLKTNQADLRESDYGLPAYSGRRKS